ncbi:MAG: hypothetical protein HGA44_08175 [Cellulomonadaceae bacterium]|nr:hypothetical protein [Cellulomonadaceae bacterium]
MATDLMKRQTELARRHGAEPSPPLPGEKLGIAANARAVPRIWPLNGLRHSPAADTCGWYVWAGEELSHDEDFFLPLHADQVAEWCPEVEPYLALPPGWRFLIAPGYEDVWFDPALLEV